MHRRVFLAILPTAATWPLAPRAQQTNMPVVGLLDRGSPDGYTPYVTRLLNQTGYVEGENVVVDYKWARGQYALTAKALGLTVLPQFLATADKVIE